MEYCLSPNELEVTKLIGAEWNYLFTLHSRHDDEFVLTSLHRVTPTIGKVFSTPTGGSFSRRNACRRLHQS